MVFLEKSFSSMINSHNYYKVLETADLIELLAEAARKYSYAIAIGESERTLDSYRELMSLLQKEIQTRNAESCAKDASTEADPVLPANT